MKEMIQNAVDAIRAVAGARPSVGLILGSGLGGLADVLEDASFVEYASIPGFPVSTAPGHAGRFVLGRLAGHGVVCMQGRFHFYEGHPMSHIAAPVRVMKALGVETLLVTNACGGVNLDFQVGDLMVIDDHINFMGANPLTGPNDAGFGPRFCDMTYAYTPALRRLADEVAAAQGVALRHGVYLGYMGPSYETPAEIRAFRVLARTPWECPRCRRSSPPATAGCLCWPSASSPIWPRACWKRSWTKTRSSRRPQPAQRCWSAWSRESWSACEPPGAKRHAELLPTPRGPLPQSR